MWDVIRLSDCPDNTWLGFDRGPESLPIAFYARPRMWTNTGPINLGTQPVVAADYFLVLLRSQSRFLR